MEFTVQLQIITLLYQQVLHLTLQCTQRIAITVFRTVHTQCWPFKLFTQTSQSTARGTNSYNCYFNSTLCFTQQCKHTTGLNYNSTTAQLQLNTAVKRRQKQASTWPQHRPNTLSKHLSTAVLLPNTKTAYIVSLTRHRACIPVQCHKQTQADTVQLARQQHLCRSGVKRPPCHTGKHTGTHVHCWRDWRVQQSEMGPGKSPSNSPPHLQ